MSNNGLVKWALQHISRERLQDMAARFSPLIAWYYRGDNFTDPIDNRSYKKLLPYGYVNIRENALAPGSLSLERHRAMYLYLKEKTNIFKDPVRLLHVAPERCFIDMFEKAPNIDYVTADLLSPWAKVHFDVHAIPFPDNSFDVVIANHLLEHVQDDHRVLQEFHRVMKVGGWGIFQVPMDESWEHTQEDPFLTDPVERERRFGQKDHLRMYGHDYEERLRRAGFEVHMVRLGEALPHIDFKRFAVSPGDLIPLCYKRS